jgi:AraC-like DNA-binding protein
VSLHCDNGSNYYVVVRGSIEVQDGPTSTAIEGPTALIFDPECTFAIVQKRTEKVEILVWVWQGKTPVPGLRPATCSFRALPLCGSLDPLLELHGRCRAEVAQPDAHAVRSLSALRRLVEVEILRASARSSPDQDSRWKLAEAWMRANLSIHTPVPALCEYLRMSPSTLHRFFHARGGVSPGAYFHSLKLREALRLIQCEGLQVKHAAYQLGYRHANELSRALSGIRPAKRS